MVDREPVAEPSFASEGSTPTPWSRAHERLAEAGEFYLSTVRPDGRPHAVPLLGMWLDGAMYFCSSESAQKVRNLAANPQCVLTAAGPDLDLSIEGTASRVTDKETLERVADGYGTKHGWPVTVVDGGLDGDGIGPAPYVVYEVTPAKVIGMDKEAGFNVTRWRFA
ncbi:pyridoxamine 5'-phosphate oxidase family protein [Micromonospora sp. WMMD558]|uniref:pyridoxamine 5'-phosphate oxidase family protein n=1 Tax=unclassified Micromonospora TaxID=2617518 RepID=UPI0012B4A717|nr:pyridoxamine 5'-phosphate oxidase family protein [Micromonospora sp. WMMC415]QGN48277.1 pyridoxamine 5'-phosphate oxidase family protein [Micromonospora sp. WMMC415]